jgi:hypothetical protein
MAFLPANPNSTKERLSSFYMRPRGRFEQKSYLTPLTAQSNVENKPPQTPKLPPKTGALALTAVTAPSRLSPYGELLPTSISNNYTCYNYASYSLPEALDAVPDCAANRLRALAFTHWCRR